MKKSSVLMLVLVTLLFSFLTSNTILDGYAFFDATTTTDTDISVAISSKFMQSTMSFDTNGGSSITPLTGYVDDPITPPSDPTKSGYAFDGWYSDTSLTTPYTISTYPFNDITLYAKWVTSKLYTITFDSNGGSAVSPIVEYNGTPISAPTAPTKTGYTFNGWYSDVGLMNAYTFTTMPAQNMTLYAKWTINQYTMTFEVNGGSAVSSITQDYGTAVSAPSDPTKEGHTFAGWFSDAGLTTSYSFTTMPAQNITIYAKWTVNQYTISFNSNGGSAVASITQNYGTTVTTPTDPTMTGYTFAGWFTDAALTNGYTFSTMPAQNLTLYAKWTINQYTISFNSNGGSAVTAITQDYGTTVTAPTAPTKTGYTFAGWFSDVALTQSYTFSTMPAENITLYAGWATAGLSFTTTTGGYSVSKGSSSAGGELIIPASYNGTPIVEIGSFKNDTSITMVSLPNGVTSIVQSAFDGCSNMTKIFIPISVTFIDKHAFRNTPNLVVYAEAPSEPSGWDKQWNKDNHTVYWGQSSY